MDCVKKIEVSGATVTEIQEELISLLSSGVPENGFTLTRLVEDVSDLSKTSIRRRLKERDDLCTALHTVDGYQQRVYWFRETSDFEQDYAALVDSMSYDIPPDAFSLQQFAARAGCSEQTAKRYLAKQVEEGTLETELVPLDGNTQRVYY